MSHKFFDKLLRIEKKKPVRESLARQGAEVLTSTPEELKKIVENDIEKWSKVIQETGITAE